MNKKCFKCLREQCSKPCCGPYSAISPQLQPLGSVLPTEIVLTPKDINLLKTAKRDDLICYEKEKLPRIKTDFDGTCAAFKNGQCEIYPNRPSICKAYPLYMDMYMGVCLLKECPGCFEDADIDAFSESISCLLDVYQYWIDHYRKHLEQ